MPETTTKSHTKQIGSMAKSGPAEVNFAEVNFGVGDGGGSSGAGLRLITWGFQGFDKPGGEMGKDIAKV